MYVELMMNGSSPFCLVEATSNSRWVGFNFSLTYKLLIASNKCTPGIHIGDTTMTAPHAGISLYLQ